MNIDAEREHHPLIRRERRCSRMYAATNRRKISCLAQEKKQEGGTVKRQACVLASRGYRLEGVCAPV